MNLKGKYLTYSQHCFPILCVLLDTLIVGYIANAYPKTQKKESISLGICKLIAKLSQWCV